MAKEVVEFGRPIGRQSRTGCLAVTPIAAPAAVFGITWAAIAGPNIDIENDVIVNIAIQVVNRVENRFQIDSAAACTKRADGVVTKLCRSSNEVLTKGLLIDMRGSRKSDPHEILGGMPTHLTPRVKQGRSGCYDLFQSPVPEPEAAVSRCHAA